MVATGMMDRVRNYISKGPQPGGVGGTMSPSTAGTLATYGMQTPLTAGGTITPRGATGAGSAGIRMRYGENGEALSPGKGPEKGTSEDPCKGQVVARTGDR